MPRSNHCGRRHPDRKAPIPGLNSSAPKPARVATSVCLRMSPPRRVVGRAQAPSAHRRNLVSAPTAGAPEVNAQQPTACPMMVGYAPGFVVELICASWIIPRVVRVTHRSRENNIRVIEAFWYFLRSLARPIVRPPRHRFLFLLATSACGRMRNAARQSADSPIRCRQGISDRAAVRERGGQRHAGGPRLLRRRHSRSGVFLRRAGDVARHAGNHQEWSPGSRARRGRCDHRHFQRKLHCAGVRPLRRKTLRHLRSEPSSSATCRVRSCSAHWIPSTGPRLRRTVGVGRSSPPTCTTNSCSTARRSRTSNATDLGFS